MSITITPPAQPSTGAAVQQGLLGHSLDEEVGASTIIDQISRNPIKREESEEERIRRLKGGRNGFNTLLDGL